MRMRKATAHAMTVARRHNATGVFYFEWNVEVPTKRNAEGRRRTAGDRVNDR